MERVSTILFAIVLCAGVTAFTGWLLWRWMQRSKDAPVVLVIKWIVSALLLITAFAAIPVLGPFGPFLIVFCAINLSVLWTPNIGSMIGGWMAGGIDGGNTPPDRKPMYSLAISLRKRGQYQECLAELRRQLMAFPDDYEGGTMLAEVLAENLQDFFSAQVILERIANSAQRPAAHRAYALTQLADWHLKFNQDVDAARASLQRIVDWLPDTELARKAAQRLSHLDARRGLPSTERAPLTLRHVAESPEALADHSTEPDAMAELSVLSEQLRHNPHDGDAREQLARLYAERLGQPEEAIQQLEQGALLAGHSPREMARWLNLKAEHQVQGLNDLAGAEATLQRLVECFPGTAFAVAAEQRIARLGVEARGKKKSQGIHLGSYESDLGLPGGKPIAGG